MKAKIVGITGTIASGKSLVGKILHELGVPVLDTDHIAHALQKNDRKVKDAVRKRFGNAVFDNQDQIDRKALAKIVFDDKDALSDLNGIIHPAIVQECNRQIEELSGETIVAVLVPLLFEAGVEKRYDEIWTVIASDDVVRSRLKARDGINDEEVDKRLRAQYPQAEKMRRSSHVIDNSGSEDATRTQVLELLKAYNLAVSNGP